jgi:CubicO group peptidase (beta-lactamase class C family)
MKTVQTFLSISLFLCTYIVSAQSDYNSAVQRRIEDVENNLISWVKLDSTKNFNIHERMKELNINGAVVAVIKDFKVDWIKAYGWADTSGKRPMTVNTMLQAASVGKSINGFGFMRLVQDGKVNLHTDINQYLKRWKFPYDSLAKGKLITIANLLSHTAGLTVHGFDGYEWSAPLPTILQTLNGQHPANNPPVRSAFEPGIKFQYSGGGITISELLLEDVTGLSYERYMQAKVFGPLKMNRSTFATHPLDSNYAAGYRFDGKKMEGKYMKFIERAAGAAFWTTAPDLARFVIEIQQSIKGKTNNVLNQSTASLMMQPFLKSSNAAFGFYNEKKGDQSYFQHSGLNPGYSSQYVGSLENGNGVVVLVNSDMFDFMTEVVNSVATVYKWKDYYPYVSKKIQTYPEDSLKRFAGKYIFENDKSGPEITYQNGQLFLKDPHSPIRWKMYFTSPCEFFMLEAKWANQQFYFDDSNNARGLYIIGDNYKANVIKVD